MISFFKMHGAGNDFVVLDQRKNPVDLSVDQRVRLCDRRRGIGCDQLIEIYESEHKQKFKIIFYNQDGSRSQACGNGSRCVAWWLMQQQGISSVSLVAGQRILDAWQDQTGAVWVNMGTAYFQDHQVPLLRPQGKTLHDALKVDYQNIDKISACSFGNPHLVCYRETAFSDQEVQRLGAAFEVNEIFPERTNVGFLYYKNNELNLRVWERGVGETLACGTGACAAFSLAVTWNIIENKKVHITLPGGVLGVTSCGHNVHLTGPVVFVADGTWHE